MADFTQDGTEYDAELVKDDTPTAVKIGGKTAKFVPNINASKWNDECWMNINHPDVVNAEKETFVDDKMELTIGNNTHRYYVDDDGRLEYEIDFATKPISNKVVLNVGFPEGLAFHYQPTLTQEEIDAGDERPDNVSGSYAVYWKNHWNKYKTGKFCHIYRPKITDAGNHWEWCDIEYKDKQLIITVGQDFLDNAIYPITLDPTFGLTTDGASTTFIDGIGSTMVGQLGTAPATATYTEFHMWAAADDSTVDFVGVVYDESAGEPNNRIAFSGTPGTASSGARAEVSAAISAALTAATPYYAGHCQEADDIRLGYDSVGGFAMRANNADDWATGPDPWTDTLTREGRQLSYWLVYAVGGISIPVVMNHLRNQRVA